MGLVMKIYVFSGIVIHKENFKNNNSTLLRFHYLEYKYIYTYAIYTFLSDYPTTRMLITRKISNCKF